MHRDLVFFFLGVAFFFAVMLLFWFINRVIEKRKPAPAPEPQPEPRRPVPVRVFCGYSPNGAHRNEVVNATQIQYPQSGQLIILQSDGLSAIFAKDRWDYAIAETRPAATAKKAPAESVDEAAPEVEPRP